MKYRFGKLEPIIDKRTIPLRNVIRRKCLPELPDEFCVDESLNGVNDDRMFNNSVYGDCVIAARAHQTLRFEKYEQGYEIDIKDQEVIDEYFKESGGVDRGLYLLSSIKFWRNEGWQAAGRWHDIYAFGSLEWKDHNEVKHCVHLLHGVNLGFRVYQSDMEQIENNEMWHLTDNAGRLLGGHGIYVYQYDDVGLTCMTWGKRQRMTWGWWDDRVDEAFGIVDNKNEWMYDDSPVDVELLDSYLKEICQDNPNPGCLFPFLRRFR